MRESARRADAWTVGRRLVDRNESIERQLEEVLRRARLPRVEVARAAQLAAGVDPASLAGARALLEVELGRDRGVSLTDLMRPAAATKKGALRC